LTLSIRDRKQLEELVKQAIKEAKASTFLARKMIPSQGDSRDFAYGLICGIIIGNFIERFTKDNGRQPDMDETADLFLIMMTKMPSIRRAVMDELESV
jgi:hypothetical protein